MVLADNALFAPQPILRSYNASSRMQLYQFTNHTQMEMSLSEQQNSTLQSWLYPFKTANFLERDMSSPGYQ